MALGCILAGVLGTSMWSIVGLSMITVGLYASNAHLFPLPAVFLTGPALATGIAWVNSVGILGGSVSPPIVGWLKDYTGNFTGGLLRWPPLGYSPRSSRRSRCARRRSRSACPVLWRQQPRNQALNRHRDKPQAVRAAAEPIDSSGHDVDERVWCAGKHQRVARTEALPGTWLSGASEGRAGQEARRLFPSRHRHDQSACPSLEVRRRPPRALGSGV